MKVNCTFVLYMYLKAVKTVILSYFVLFVFNRLCYCCSEALHAPDSEGDVVLTHSWHLAPGLDPVQPAADQHHEH